MIETFENNTPQIEKGSFIHDSSVIIGDVEIGTDCSVWPMVVIRGDVNSIRIGNETNIQDLSMLHVSHDGPYLPGGAKLTIGERVTIGHKVMLHGCTIHDEVLVGMNAIIMDRAVIESHVLIGAGALIPPNKTITSGLWVGQPAKKVRDLTPEEIKQIQYSAQHYIRLKNRHLA